MLKHLMDSVKALRQRLWDKIAPSQTSRHSSTLLTPSIFGVAGTTMMRIPELKEVIFIELSLFDLLVVTQVSKGWLDFILSSMKTFNRLLHGNLPVQYATRTP